MSYLKIIGFGLVAVLLYKLFNMKVGIVAKANPLGGNPVNPIALTGGGVIPAPDVIKPVNDIGISGLGVTIGVPINPPIDINPMPYDAVKAPNNLDLLDYPPNYGIVDYAPNYGDTMYLATPKLDDTTIMNSIDWSQYA